MANMMEIFVNRDFKQVIILRNDLGMSTGKKVAQACHAAVIAVEMAKKMNPEIYQKWSNEGQKKVALKVQTEKELLDLYNMAKSMKFPCAIIQDAGLTELPPGTITAVAIGPGKSNDIDKITGQLKLL